MTYAPICSPTSWISALTLRKSPTSKRPFIPPELVDRIIDFLHSDKKALSNCCLVSREWAYTSRYHLFSSIEIHVPPTDSSCHESLKRFFSPTSGTSTLRGYVKTFRIACLDGRLSEPSTRPKICSHLLRMVFGKLRNLEALYLFGVRFAHQELSDSWIVSGAVSPVEDTTMHECVVEHQQCMFQSPDEVLVDGEGGTLMAGPSNFPKPIQLLSLEHCGHKADRVSNIIEILSLISASSISRLEMWYLHPPSFWADNVTASVDSLPTLTEGQNFILDQIMSHDFPIDMIFSSPPQNGPPSFETLEELKVSLDMQADVDAVSSIIRKIGRKNLRRFCMDLTPYLQAIGIEEFETIDWTDFGLTECKKLDLLTLRLDVAGMVVSDPDCVSSGRAKLTCNYPTRLLSTIPTTSPALTPTVATFASSSSSSHSSPIYRVQNTSSITKISIYLLIRGQDEYLLDYCFDWEALERTLLDEGRFEKLEVFAVEVLTPPRSWESKYGDGPELDEYDFWEKLPRLTEKGLLRIGHTGRT
ncbi:hypothetical protein C8Q75DRAFT_470571 [Abortiporus biennis]|nr:hypothetical protein C8Q75DRAFT_470571 [Abortiporus biennis]